MTAKRELRTIVKIYNSPEYRLVDTSYTVIIIMRQSNFECTLLHSI